MPFDTELASVCSGSSKGVYDTSSQGLASVSAGSVPNSVSAGPRVLLPFQWSFGSRPGSSHPSTPARQTMLTGCHQALLSFTAAQKRPFLAPSRKSVFLLQDPDVQANNAPDVYSLRVPYLCPLLLRPVSDMREIGGGRDLMAVGHLVEQLLLKAGGSLPNFEKRSKLNPMRSPPPPPFL